MMIKEYYNQNNDHQDIQSNKRIGDVISLSDPLTPSELLNFNMDRN